MRIATLVVLLPGLMVGVALSGAEPIWIEGEQPAVGSWHEHPWYSGAVDTAQLSGGAFASSFTESGPTELTYRVEIPKAGSYQLWLRANPVQSRISWRLDQGAWQEVDTGAAIDTTNIALDGKPDLRFIAWIPVGSQQLRAGFRDIGIRFHSKNHHHGALDCLVLSAGTFMPSGKAKPGEHLDDADPGCFAFDPGIDAFTGAALDLRHLNEPVAGASGPLRCEGDRILLGDGTPVRFWAANAGPATDHAGADHLARRLAKNGYNAARLHGLLADRTGEDPLALNPAKLDAVHYAVKANREQGLYTHLSCYFPLWVELRESDRVPGGLIGKHPFALLLFDERFQTLWKAWTRRLLTSPNPYTGITLAEDPAVGFFEIHNEDSFFFYTFSEDKVGAGPWARLEARFLSWVEERHGSLAKAVRAWGKGSEHEHDSASRAGLSSAWHMTAEGMSKVGAGTRARLLDQRRFLAELQHRTYAELRAWVRDELGFRGLVTASNWRAADDATTLAIERWTYSATDLTDSHAYFGGKHSGDRSGWSIQLGHEFSDRAAVLEPAASPLGRMQLLGRPHIVSENAWSRPNRLVADSQLLISSYAALQGIDGWFAFATHDGAWNRSPTAKWPLIMPGHFGQSPAAALQYRRGDVQEAPVVLRQVQTVAQLFEPGQGGMIEGENADFRVAQAPQATDPGASAGFDPLCYFVGRVERALIGVDGVPQGIRPTSVDLAQHIDRERQVVDSVTGQLHWDWGRGLMTVDAPASQAATGHLGKAGSIALQDVRIRCGNEFATVHVISLDGQPLARSRELLIQAFTREHLHGFREERGRITSLGRAPINVERIDATVQLPGTGWRAVALTGNGYERGPVDMRGSSIDLPPDALYTIVRR